MGGERRGDFAGQQIEGGVVAADGDGGVLDALGFAQEFDLDLGAGRDAFGKAGDGDQAVGPHQRHDHAGRALQRGGDDSVADAADTDADELVVTGMGDKLAWGDGLDHAAWRRGTAQALLNEGADKEFECERGGNRDSRGCRGRACRGRRRGPRDDLGEQRRHGRTRGRGQR